MVNVMLKFLDIYFFGMSSDVLAFKVSIFASDCEFLIEVMKITSKHSNTTFAPTMLSADPLFKV